MDEKEGCLVYLRSTNCCGATVTVLAEVKGQFAVFRDLHAKLSEHAAFQGVLAAPFPVTKRRSSLGIKMNDDAVEERRQELNLVNIRALQINFHL